MGQAAQVLKQVAVEAEVRAQPFGRLRDFVILGMPKVKCLWGTGNRIVSVSNAPKSWTFFWWHDGQNQRPLHENASRYSCLQ